MTTARQAWLEERRANFLQLVDAEINSQAKYLTMPSLDEAALANIDGLIRFKLWIRGNDQLPRFWSPDGSKESLVLAELQLLTLIDRVIENADVKVCLVQISAMARHGTFHRGVEKEARFDSADLRQRLANQGYAVYVFSDSVSDDELQEVRSTLGDHISTYRYDISSPAQDRHGVVFFDDHRFMLGLITSNTNRSRLGDGVLYIDEIKGNEWSWLVVLLF